MTKRITTDAKEAWPTCPSREAHHGSKFHVRSNSIILYTSINKDEREILQVQRRGDRIGAKEEKP